MKYFMDTEFHEYHKQQKCFGIKVGKPIPTIDLISIGIVSEDDRKYYAISKDFNIKDAWNSYQLKDKTIYEKQNGFSAQKEYWLRDNVLKPIFKELLLIDGDNENILIVKYYRYPTNSKGLNEMIIDELCDTAFTLRNFKKLINKYGKTNKQIAEEIKAFIYEGSESSHNTANWGKNIPFEFYGYYADYDWVVFTQLYGRMIDLPEGYPMYCKDLKQMFDEKVDKLDALRLTKLTKIDIKYGKAYKNDVDNDFSSKLKIVKKLDDYPKQNNGYNALDYAKWSKRLYEFIKQL